MRVFFLNNIYFSEITVGGIIVKSPYELRLRDTSVRTARTIHALHQVREGGGVPALVQQVALLLLLVMILL